MPPIGPSSELTHAGRPYELTLLVSTVLVLNVLLILRVVFDSLFGTLLDPNQM